MVWWKTMASLGARCCGWTSAGSALYSSPLNLTILKPGGMSSWTCTSRAATCMVLTKRSPNIFSASASLGMKSEAPRPASVTASMRASL